jgi:hypothetical protein
MLEGFSDDAEMEFRGIPVGPFIGKDAIAAAYLAQPPDDEMRVLEEREQEGRVEARYAWLAEPGVAAGEMLVTHEGGLIRKLVVTFDRGVELEVTRVQTCGGRRRSPSGERDRGDHAPRVLANG